MLKKLIKHEFIATYRIFLPIYVALAALTGLACLAVRFIDNYNPALLQIASGFGIIIVILGFMFVILSPFIFLSMRFYRTTATREAYLTFTVPADTKLIVLAKFIVSYLWTAVTTILWFFALLTFMNSASPAGKNLLVVFFKNLFSPEELASTLLYFAVLATTLACSILSIFAAISLGQLVRDHRVIASFAFYAAIYTVQQIVSVLVMLPWMISIFESSKDVVVDETTVEFGYSSAMGGDDTAMFLVSIALSLVFSVVFYLLSNYMLKKKLNLL